MKMHTEEYEELCVITLKGDVAGNETDKLRNETLSRMKDDRVRDFVIDCAEVDFVDSEGLETFLWMQERCAEKLGQVRLAAPRENLSTILNITRLSNRFDAHESIDAAVKSLR